MLFEYVQGAVLGSGSLSVRPSLFFLPCSTSLLGCEATSLPVVLLDLSPDGKNVALTISHIFYRHYIIESTFFTLLIVDVPVELTRTTDPWQLYAAILSRWSGAKFRPSRRTKMRRSLTS